MLEKLSCLFSNASMPNRKLKRSLSCEALEGRALLNVDYGSDSFSTAPLVASDADRVIQEAVGGIDRNDYFKFVLSRQALVDIALTALSQDIDVALYDSNHSLIGQSTWGGNRDESIVRTLPAGEYFVRAYPYGNAQSSYNLNLDISPVVAPDHAGNSRNSARDIGQLSSNATFRDFVSRSGDTDDFYRFRVSRTVDFSLQLSGMLADADIELQNSSGQVLVSSTRASNSSEAISRQLTAGTYFVRVYAFAGETSYDLHMSVRQVASPDVVTESGRQLRNLIDSFRVTTNSAYQPRNGLTYCNVFAADVAESFGVTLPNGRRPWSDGLYYSANRLSNWLPNQGRNFGWSEVSSRDAQTLANQGRFAVAVWFNTTGNGHIAVIRPHEWNGAFAETNGPMVTQAGRVNSDAVTVRTGFGRTSGVRYYVV